VRIAFFCHTVRSDWNHGHSHFLRGVVRALQLLGHTALVYEEARSWSVTNLVREHGLAPLLQFRRRFPFIDVRLYEPEPPAALRRRLEDELAGADAVVLDEWPAVEHPALTELLIQLRRSCGYALLLRDAHSRVLTQPVPLRERLDRFDSVLVYGPSMADEYRSGLGLTRGVHVLHEAADVALFRPGAREPERPPDDAVFIGNWGEGDRADDLRRFLLGPAQRFGGRRRFAVHGVRYPPRARAALAGAGVEYRGWLPNYLVPEAFARARVGLHLIRRQYAARLHGIPTIRVFEALACGLPLVSTRWRDTDHLFREGQDYLLVDTPTQTEEVLEWLWRDDDARARLGQSGMLRVLGAHTCLHRAEQLLEIVASCRVPWVARGVRLAGEPVVVTAGAGDVPPVRAAGATPADGPGAVRARG
jgi:spore maturation protein CgeB